MESTEADSQLPSGSMVCESCGTTHQDFQGWSVWDAKLATMFFAQSWIHIGGYARRHPTSWENPLWLESRVKFEQSVDELKKQLLSAIEKEDFEKAAELRDQLKALEKEAQV